MNNFGIIGDVHGHIGDYEMLVYEVESSLQLGDMGFNYKALDKFDPIQHKFLPGNHDNYTNVERTDLKPEDVDSYGPYTVRDGKVYHFIEFPETFIGNYGRWTPPNCTEELFFVRGANSIDQHRRIQGVDWWPEEELTNQEMTEAIKLYEKIKPRVVVTHDAPLQVFQHIKLNSFFGGKPNLNPTIRALDALLDVHRPDIWIFGHHHQDVKFQHVGTEFWCLDELSMLMLNEKLEVQGIV